MDMDLDNIYDKVNGMKDINRKINRFNTSLVENNIKEMISTEKMEQEVINGLYESDYRKIQIQEAINRIEKELKSLRSEGNDNLDEEKQEANLSLNNQYYYDKFMKRHNKKHKKHKE